MVEELLGTEPINSKNGPVNPIEAVQGYKLIAFYCSMHTCPPCREFTPIFAELYNELNADDKVI